MKRLMIVLLLTLLLATSVSAKERNLMDDLEPNEGLGLPWYAVADWEIQVCTQGLSTSTLSIPGTNRITSSSIVTPIYTDTITLLAKKTLYGETSYYEIGWYVQPLETTAKVNLTVIDEDDVEHAFAGGVASSAAAFEGYRAFTIPCTSGCPTQQPLAKVKLQWTVNGVKNQVVSRFVTVDERE